MHTDLGLKHLAWMEMSSMGSGLPPLGDREQPETLPTLWLRGGQRAEGSGAPCLQAVPAPGTSLWDGPRILDVGG